MSKLSRKYGQNYLAREQPYFFFFIGLDSSVLLKKAGEKKEKLLKMFPSQ